MIVVADAPQDAGPHYYFLPDSPAGTQLSGMQSCRLRHWNGHNRLVRCLEITALPNVEK